MMFPIKGEFRITSGFDQMRPLSVPSEDRYHVHGAWDIAHDEDIYAPIYAPVRGKTYFYVGFRTKSGVTWEFPTWKDNRKFPFRNYWYDLYGSVILLEGDDGLWHIFCHSYANQVINKDLVADSFWDYEEDLYGSERFPNHALHTVKSPKFTQEGDIIGYIGNAGYSTGAHVHYEIHDGTFQKWGDRVRPDELYPEEAKEL